MRLEENVLLALHPNHRRGMFKYPLNLNQCDQILNLYVPSVFINTPRPYDNNKKMKLNNLMPGVSGTKSGKTTVITNEGIKIMRYAIEQSYSRCQRVCVSDGEYRVGEIWRVEGCDISIDPSVSGIPDIIYPSNFSSLGSQ